jgi:hypothetical protein
MPAKPFRDRLPPVSGVVRGQRSVFGQGGPKCDNRAWLYSIEHGVTSPGSGARPQRRRPIVLLVVAEFPWNGPSRPEMRKTPMEFTAFTCQFCSEHQE